MSFFQCVIYMISRRPRAYIGLLQNSIMISAIFFCYLLIVYNDNFHIDKFYLLYDFLKNISLYTTIIIVMCIFFSLCYSIFIIYKNKRKQIAILLLLGVQPRQLQRMLMVETLCIGSIATALGILLGTFFNQALLYLLKYGIRIFDIGFQFSWQAFWIAFILFLSLFLLVAITMPLLIRGQSVIQLLRVDQRVDDKPRSPFGLCLAVVSFLCLGSVVGVCFFSKHHDGHSAKIHLVFCTALTFIGSYLFYRQGSAYLVQGIQRNRRFSWKGIRLLWIGNMAYHVRENAFVLFVASILMMLMFSLGGVAYFLYKVHSVATDQEHHRRMITLSATETQGRITPEAGRMESIFRNISFSKGLHRTVVRELDLNAGSEEEKKKRVDERIKFLKNPSPPSVLIPYTEGKFSSLQSYNEGQRREGLPILSLQAGEAAVDCHKKTESICRRYISMYPLPLEWGVQRVKYLFTGTRSSWHGNTLVRTPPSWILEDQSFAIAFQYPGIRVKRTFYYDAPSSQLNSQTIDSMFNIRNFHIKTRLGRGYEVDDGGHQRFWATWVGTVILLSVLTVFLILLFIGSNFLLLRIYTDMEGQRRSFRSLLPIGFSISHLRRSITVQMAILFFMPVGLSSFLSFCSLVYYYKMLYRESIHNPMGSRDSIFYYFVTMIMIFLVIQIGIFLISRASVLRDMEKKG